MLESEWSWMAAGAIAALVLLALHVQTATAQGEPDIDLDWRLADAIARQPTDANPITRGPDRPLYPVPAFTVHHPAPHNAGR